MRAKQFRGRNSMHSPAASKTLKQSFKATGKKAVVEKTCKANTMLQRLCGKKNEC